MRFTLFTALALVMAAPAAAQAINPGMQVTDASGGSVGTVAAVRGDNVLVKTDKHEALLPKSSFRVDGNKLMFGMTQAQLNAQIEKSLNASKAAIAAGAVVKGSGGTQIGTIEAVAAEGVTIALTAGQKIQVGESALRGNADGSVTVGYTAEQLQELVGAKEADGSAEANSGDANGDANSDASGQ